MADTVVFQSVNQGQFSTFPGKDNIFINYEFDNHSWDQNDLNKEIDRIINEKSKGICDTLLIWGEQFELLHQDKEISEIMFEKFQNTKFENVFLLTFSDKPGELFETSKLFPIKLGTTGQ